MSAGVESELLVRAARDAGDSSSQKRREQSPPPPRELFWRSLVRGECSKFVRATEESMRQNRVWGRPAFRLPRPPSGTSVP